MRLIKARDSDRPSLSNRVVQISVQLLSPEVLACEMVEKHALLYVILSNLHFMINSITSSSTINGEYELLYHLLRVVINTFFK